LDKDNPKQQQKDAIFARGGRTHWGEITISDDKTREANRRKPRGTGTVHCRDCGKKFETIPTYQQHRLGRPDHAPCPTPRELRRAGWRKDEKGFWQCLGGRGTRRAA
jgi:hypothetical protein